MIDKKTRVCDENKKNYKHVMIFFDMLKKQRS